MRDFQNIVILTGAGISAESGIKTFRDADGLWEGHRIEEVATPEAFERNPKLVHEFYNLRRKQLFEVQPNPAHLCLAESEKRFQGSWTLISQNVDDLHKRAGSKNLISMHGQLRQVRCIETGEVFDWDQDLSLETPHPRNGKKGVLRPHICWFGEMPFEMDTIEQALQKADLFIVIGTSGNVYPAAGFVSWVPSKCKTVLINKEPALNTNAFDEVLIGPATLKVPEYFTQIRL